MCGIFGIFTKGNLIQDDKYLLRVLDHLYLLSESRGHDASGVACVTDNNIFVYKEPICAKKFIKTSKYKEILSKSDISLVMGHARMETNGSFSNSDNNQPVIKDGCVSVHNGIIVNDEELFKETHIKRKYKVDTEIINSLLKLEISKPKPDVQKVFNKLTGSYSVCVLFDTLDVALLASNTGSLYYVMFDQGFIFASEGCFLQKIAQKYKKLNFKEIKHFKPNTYMFVRYNTCKTFQALNNNIKKRQILNLENYVKTPNVVIQKVDEKALNKFIDVKYENNLEKIQKLKRCTKCVLPETMPFITFDEAGVCNYCTGYTPLKVKGVQNLQIELSKYKKYGDRPNCIVAFSGGRDSSYGLHVVKEELKMNPVAYSYDWGMLTDLGRRNQALMTGKLGVEHILISADIQKKRQNIQKNVKAWLNKPNLGTIPLLMAGDKQYFYYANMLKKQMGIDLVILCENLLEKTDFKSGFCGIAPQKIDNPLFYKLSFSSSLKMMFYYFNNIITNPSYINSSVMDTLWAFQSYYFIRHKYTSLYKYVHWSEEEVENTLDRYGWERAKDTDSTWRIGDGTASFYNYIYYSMAGITENDTFRSNQIREGAITRDQALVFCKRDNKPRIESLIWYSNIVGFNLLKALKSIESSRKLYK